MIADSRIPARFENPDIAGVAPPDNSQPLDWQPLLQQCDVVIHLAGIARVRGRRTAPSRQSSDHRGSRQHQTSHLDPKIGASASEVEDQCVKDARSQGSRGLHATGEKHRRGRRRPDVKIKLGIDYESGRKVHPRIVHGSVSDFSQNGPACMASIRLCGTWAGCRTSLPVSRLPSTKRASECRKQGYRLSSQR